MIGEREYLQLSMQVSQNIHTTMELRSDLNNVEDQMAEFFMIDILFWIMEWMMKKFIYAVRLPKMQEEE